MSLRRHIHRSVAPVAVECVIAIVGTLQSPPRGLATVNWQVGLAMRRGNAGPGNIGNDFDRLGVSLWRDLYSMDGRNRVRNIKLDNLNKWRNAIAHDDFRNAQVFPNGSRTGAPVGESERLAPYLQSCCFEHGRTYAKLSCATFRYVPMVATKMPHQLRRDDVVRFKFGLRQVQGKVTGVLRSSTTTRDSLYRVEFSVGEA